MLGGVPGASLNQLFQASLGNEDFIWIVLIVDDYFSPLMTGAVMRPLTDKVGVPREKLAFLLDATTASVCILVPFTAWGAYLASLIAAQGGPVSSVEDGLSVFIHAIPYNFYPMLIIGFALLVALRVIPDFGPMRRAERRVQETGAADPGPAAERVGCCCSDHLGR